MDEARIKKLEDTLANLSTNMSAMVDVMKVMQTKQPKEEKKEEKRSSEYKDLESLSRNDFMKVIVEQISGMIDDKIGGVSTRVRELGDNVSSTELQREIKRMETSKKDFWDWRKEMAEIAKRSPGLTVDEVYDLARMKNPDRARELDEKYKSDEQKAAEAKAKEPKPDIFSGLMPTSGKTVENDKMTPDSAAEAAWTKVFGGAEGAQAQ